jgi:hypothetical protein
MTFSFALLFESRIFHQFSPFGGKGVELCFRVVRYLLVGGAWRRSRHLFQLNNDPTIAFPDSQPISAGVDS